MKFDLSRPKHPKRNRLNSHYALRRLVVASREPPDPELEALRASRPQTRGECGTERPCPWVSCRHNLYLDINPLSGTIKLNTDVEPWDVAESCSLDVAERGPVILDVAGRLLGVTRERTRQIERQALRKLRMRGEP